MSIITIKNRQAFSIMSHFTKLDNNFILSSSGGAIVAGLIEVLFLDSALGINDRLAGYACSYPHLENSEVV